MFSPAHLALTSVVVAASVAITVRRRARDRPRVRAALAVMVGGLVVGTSTHVAAFLEYGVVSAPNLPLGYNLFWASLAVLDPLAAALLVVRPRAGVAAAATIIAVDLIVNAGTARGSVLSPSNWMLWCQLAYAVFVLAAWPMCWSATNAAGGSVASRA